MIPGYLKKILIIAVLITVGIVLELTGLLDAKKTLELARGYTDEWWLVLVLILLQTTMYTFALAGSFFLWVIAPLYPPVEAALILTLGGTLGGVGAYWFSQRLTDDWITRIENSRTYRMLRKHDNFLAIFALRVLPTFPHSIVNYSSGILKVKLSHFILAALIGLSIKEYAYAQVIYKASSSASLDDLMNISTYGPLILLSVISMAGVFIKYKLSVKKGDQ